jgi:hypothetical protein
MILNHEQSPGCLVKIHYLEGVDNQRPKMYANPYDRKPMFYFGSGSDNTILGIVITSDVVRSKPWAYVLLEGNMNIGWIPWAWLQRISR